MVQSSVARSNRPFRDNCGSAVIEVQMRQMERMAAMDQWSITGGGRQSSYATGTIGPLDTRQIVRSIGKLPVVRRN